MADEQRKHVRYRVKTKAYVALGEEYSRVGRIEDISWGGLAFRSINNSGFLEQEHSRIAIVVSANGFYLPNLSCRVVHKTLVQEFASTQASGKSLRVTLCGVEFESLGSEGIKQLKFFLEHYSTFDGDVKSAS